MFGKVTSIVLFLLSIVLVLSFQNCSSQTPFASPDAGPVEKLINGDLFPYEATFDQVAYMSCSEQKNVAHPDPQTFFTFRMGAYRSSGLSLVRDFFDATEKMQEDEKVAVLAQQLLSSGTRMQFATRSTGNFQLAFVNEDSGTEGAEGYDFANIFTSIGDESLSTYLLRTPVGSYMNTWAGAPFTSQYRFEGSLNFMASELIQNELRSFLSSQGMLALTFSDEGKISPRGPGYMTGDTRDLTRNVFGTAVQLKFKQPLPADFEPTVALPGDAAPKDLFAGATASTDMPPRLLASVTEVFIDKRKQGTPPKTWICPRELAFRIVMPFIKNGDVNVYHADDQNCRTQADPAQPSATLQAIRQTLYVEDWYVDVENRCVVPKSDRALTGACYGINSNLQTTHQIQYDFTQPCGIGTGNGVCPHFVSICVRE